MTFTSLKPGRRQLFAFLTCALFYLALSIRPALADEVPLASPISDNPSGEVHSGRIVWADLLTTDLPAAAAFYAAVFDWQSNTNADGTYAELAYDGDVMSSIVRYDGDDAETGDAQWLVSISVADVDAAARAAAAAGGEVLEQPTDLPDRGRYALIRDPQGALAMLLRATGGDPADEEPELGQWAFAELWTDDSDAAVRFYSSVAGYSTRHMPDSDGDEHLVLVSDGRPRATVVELPWDDVEPNWLPYIPVADLADTLQRIVGAGGAVLIRSPDAAIAVDPTGGAFAVQQVESQR